MLRVRVVGLMEQDCVRVMVDGDSHRPAGGKFNSRGSPAAPGEVVHDDLVKNIYKMSFLVSRILGAKQKKALYDHLRDASGRVPVDAVEREMEDIFAAFGQQGKNS